MSPLVIPLLNPPLRLARIDAGIAQKAGLSTQIGEILNHDGIGTFADVALSEAGIISSSRSLRGRLRRKPPTSSAEHLAGVDKIVAADRHRDLPQPSTNTQMGFRITDAGTGERLLSEARAAGRLDALWIVAGELDLLSDLRGQSEMVHLILSCAPASISGGAERLAAHLRTLDITGCLVPEADLTAGAVALMHRFTRVAIADGAEYERTVVRALHNGADGVVSPNLNALLVEV